MVEALVNLAAQQRPGVVVLSGDITQRARPAQFRAAKAFVDRLGSPVSSRVRNGVPNSVNLLRWGADAAPGCCRIEQWDYKANDRAFRLAKVSEVRLDRT